MKFERLLETYLSFAPRGRRSFVAALPVWLKEKLFLKSMLYQGIRSTRRRQKIGPPADPVYGTS